MEAKFKKILLIFWLGGFVILAIWKNLNAWESKRKLQFILEKSSQQRFLPIRTQSKDCMAVGPLPDKNCTPGAAFQNISVEQICVPGYTKKVRDVSLNLKKEIYVEYAIAYPQAPGALEVDHLIPLALGGNNDIANLWPESAFPAPGFKEKDIVEIYLQEEVCAGRVNLNRAQAQVADNWLQVYENLSPDIIRAIKAKYKNWSN